MKIGIHSQQLNHSPDLVSSPLDETHPTSLPQDMKNALNIKARACARFENRKIFY